MALLLASAIIPPAAAQQTPATVDTQDTATLGKVLDAMQGHRMSEALAILDPLLADFEKRYAGEKRAIFCADNMADTLLVLALAATGKDKSQSPGAIALGPNWCLALWAKGFVLNDLQQVDKAIPFLERAAAMAPFDAHYLSELGQSYQSLRQWDKALTTFRRAADAAGRYDGDLRVRELGRAWRGEGYQLVELKRWDEAETMYRKCLELNPSDRTAAGELDYVKSKRPKN